MFPLRAVAWHFICACFLVISSALAQGNPEVAACGLPAQGNIIASVTYTLTADCEQTGELAIGNADPKITVTVDGGGHTITGGKFALFRGTSANLNLNSVTIEGVEALAIQVDTLTVSMATFTGNEGTLISARRANLTNVLFSGNELAALSLGGNPVVLFVFNGASYTLNNVVLRNNFKGGGAVLVANGGALTTNGCLTLSGNTPYDVYVVDGGTWTNNSTGPCAGAIGNGDSAVIPAPSLMSCGFPAPGNLDSSATYTLTADCVLTDAYYISPDVNIRVIGNARTMRTSRTDYTFIIAATGSLTLENIALVGVRFWNWGDLRAKNIKVTNTVGGIFFNMGEVRVTTALFEGNSVTHPRSRSVALAYGAYNKGLLSFTDTTFRGNTGGHGALVAVNGAIELKGGIHFVDNSPADIHPSGSELVKDERDPNSGSPIDDPLMPPTVAPKPEQQSRASANAPKPRPRPAASNETVSTCDYLPNDVVVSVRVPQTQCQLITGAAIGDDDLAAQALSAVDVWGWAPGNTRICFKADSGSIRFIDTNSMPRRTMDKETFSDGGMICAMIDGPGIAVLVAGPPAATSVPGASAAPRTLSNCMVTTTEILNFRESPGGGLVIRDWIPNSWLPKGASLTAVERRGGWFKVDYYGVKGWISGDYVETEGTCG